MDTLAICDTEPIVIEGMRTLLGPAEGLRIVAAETSLADSMASVRELRPSLLIVDKAFGIHPVMEWLRDLRKEASGTSVIVWSNSLSEAEALRFLQAGACGVVRKTAPVRTVLDCIDTVASGISWMEDGLLSEADRPVRHARSPLTSRELQVMELVERGLKNKDIAASLGIRTGTVKIHLRHIFEKTGIRGRYGLALSGLREKGMLAAPAILTV